MIPLFRTNSRSRDARAAYAKALALPKALAEDFPASTAYRQELALQLGRPAAARRHLEDAIAHERAALKLDPEGGGYRRELSKQYRNLARALRQLKDPAGAAAADAEAER